MSQSDAGEAEILGGDWPEPIQTALASGRASRAYIAFSIRGDALETMTGAHVSERGCAQLSPTGNGHRRASAEPALPSHQIVNSA